MKSLFKIAITTSSIFIAVGFMVENVNAVTLGEIEENRDEFSWSFDYNSLERGLGSTIGTVNFTPFKSDFWQVSLTASRNLTDNTIQLLTVNAQHTSKPPGDDHDLDSGTGNSVSFNLSGSNTQTSAIHPSGETTGGHNDLYTFFLSSGSPNSTFTITGKHEAEPVPEPLTIFSSGIALGFGALIKKEYSRKQKKVRKLEKQKV